MFEAILIQHRAFGDSEYIHEQFQVCYQRRLKKISAYLPVAGRLLEALCQATPYTRYRVIGDPVVRRAIQDALQQLDMGAHYGLPVEECEAVFQATIHHLESGKQGGPLECGITHVPRLGPEPYHGWVWSEEHSDDVFGRCFRAIVQENYHGFLCTPNGDELAVLTKGARLLGDLLPVLSQSALSHTHVIAVFPAAGWKRMSSSSQFRIGGTIFLNREALDNPWWAAEHLLHESLHQKLYDFRHGHSLLAQDSLSNTSSLPRDTGKVCSLWNIPNFNNETYWDTHRVVAAFHVYVHLALLGVIAEQRASECGRAYGLHGLLAMTDSRSALDRAQYLGEKLKELCWQELGLAGKRLIDWLLSVLEGLDPCPPPQGSYVHLLLDRYQREAKKIKSVLRHDYFDTVNRELTGSADLPQQLVELVDDEIKSARCVLSTLNEEDELTRFNTAVAQCPEDKIGTKFVEMRGLIAKSLLQVPRDRYVLTHSSSASASPSDIVKQMVEHSSQRLTMILPKS
jgi:hypothetical protein